MFSSVILTPLGVNSGRPSGNPSTGAPLTCLPSTATRGLSLNLRTGGNYFYLCIHVVDLCEFASFGCFYRAYFMCNLAEILIQSSHCMCNPFVFDLMRIR